MYNKILDRNGFVPIKIPSKLINELSKAIIQDISYKLFNNEKKYKKFSVIEKKILSLPGKIFLDKFGHNAQRQLSSNVINDLNKWVKKRIPNLVKSKKACINYISESDRTINKKLKKKQIMVFYRLVRKKKKI